MREVFSRWPSQAASRGIGTPSVASQLPPWMRAVPGRPWRSLTQDFAVAIVLVLLPAILIGMTDWSAFWHADHVAVASGVIGLVTAFVGLVAVIGLRRSSRRKGDEFQAIFERAGVSMWREDWTAAGEAIAALRQSGVTDIEGYFATRPEELRAICGKVRITDVNAFTLEETGATDKAAYLGPLDRLLPPTDQTFVQWLVAFGRGDRYFRSEAHVTGANGQPIDTLFTARLPNDMMEFSDIIVTSLDITEFKRMQARLAAAETELARAARITTIGAFGASIAHEVNTPLAAIAANAQAALRWLKRPVPELGETVAALEDVIIATVRARDVVARARSFFSKSPMDSKPIDLVGAARDAILFAERDIRANGAVVSLAADPELPVVTGDLVQIQQVFVNLITNAAQAMARSNERRDIAVTIRRREDAVRVTVSDVGPGIEMDQRACIFEPFHSTKANGMGMGLAICRNCIDAHGGAIWVDDAPNGGAAFHFELPISRATVP